MTKITPSPYYTKSPDAGVLMGDAALARRVSRVPLRRGRPRRCWAALTSLGQLAWHYRYPGGGTGIAGLVSRAWWLDTLTA